jgi:hypothetical protein
MLLELASSADYPKHCSGNEDCWIEIFRPEMDNITDYLEPVKLFFIANDVPDGKQVAVLLSAIGSKPYGSCSQEFAGQAPRLFQYCRTH